MRPFLRLEYEQKSCLKIRKLLNPHSLVRVSQIDITVEQHHIALGYTGFLPET